MFAPLPKSFVKLAASVAKMDVLDVRPPPPTQELARRLRAAFAAARGTQYRRLSRVDIRKLPFAWWLDGEPTLTALHPDLVERYWSRDLPTALSSSRRRAQRWLTPLFFTYCERFQASNPEFLEFSRRLVDALRLAQGVQAQTFLKMHQERQFFNPTVAANQLSMRFVDSRVSLQRVHEEHCLWPSFTDCALGRSTLGSALSLPESLRRDEALVSRLLEWLERQPTPVQRSSHRVNAVEGLLGPWRRSMPSAGLKRRLIDFFVSRYGDPRLPSSASYQWLGVPEDLIQLLKRWMAGDTLRGFMHVLSKTADEIWLYRQKFWLGFYEAGHIDEAWVALGPEAKFRARGLLREGAVTNAGNLTHGLANQSVLILNIGHLRFTEWSHSGSLRAYIAETDDAPALYQSSYDARDLRHMESLDFHAGQQMRPQLRHDGSSTGTWQRKARDFIRHHTGIHLNDSTIIL